MAKNKTEIEKIEDKIVTRDDTRHLQVKLTQEEIIEAGQKAADAQNQITELTNELKQSTDSIKGRKTIAEGELSRNSTLVRQKYDIRRVPCKVIMNHTKKLMMVIRQDTFETVESRKMTEDEAAVLPL